MVEYPTFLVSYPFDGSQWGCEIKARDFAEAEARVKALCWAKVDGQSVAKIPLGPQSWWRRLLRASGSD